ncbi:hypothetical protein KAFR_0G02170 [Kazachstania africana CBS 2517]|uniref:Secreted protein CSS2 C-terminal domain-containing protein n=1 Tax=Kazachstania africana (strain ATCC 22294 / BCRC 22015 / CBS 2517 / CECT 1963 / NBRC 1671 / NRRL Y-8276) TaxID=1071382 RepID=H2AXZ9_KAZAF|nr:hypothetical protein KAFR_0G02160 [Kazachstania africana CBS 2517]XP_003958385.1 hypothetical protein KAFR_0G02170 [Kazachstania africana CBS 2517]CCF59249.1 hypothetical protein KAFR_0G02160 [Kazachstania africana CBS 2517]CCF59250.1 hypothetical protein KAFR_0G02170 [Kazachstania africana CBS 2517]
MKLSSFICWLTIALFQVTKRTAALGIVAGPDQALEVQAKYLTTTDISPNSTITDSESSGNQTYSSELFVYLPDPAGTDNYTVVISSGTNLDKRTDVVPCLSEVLTETVCRVIYENVSLWWSIATVIYDYVHGDKCGPVTGSYNGVYYKYWADSGDCSSTALTKTIAGSLEYAFDKYMGNRDLCDTYTVKMTHGGTWIGNLVVGPNAATWLVTSAASGSGSCYSSGCGGLTSPYGC